LIVSRLQQVVQASKLKNEHSSHATKTLFRTHRASHLLTFLNILSKEVPFQYIFQLHDNFGILYRFHLLFDFCPNQVVQLLWQNHLDTADESHFVDGSPWLLLSRWLAAIDVARKRAKSRENLGILSPMLLAQEIEHFGPRCRVLGGDDGRFFVS